MTKEERIKNLEAELTMLIKDDEEQQECIINQIKEIKELQEENKMQHHALERLRNIIKEAREWVLKQQLGDERIEPVISTDELDGILEILDKENK